MTGWVGIMSEARRIATTPMTVDEFRRWADRQPGKWELVHGEPRAMSPASLAHSLIQARAASLIDRHLDAAGSRCRVATEVAVIPATFSRSNARSAHLAVTCAPRGEDRWDMAAPVFILEILSPTNERDTRDNVWAYMTIPSVRQILLLRSVRMGGEMFARGPDGGWPEEAVELSAPDPVGIDPVGFACALRDFYASTSLAQP